MKSKTAPQVTSPIKKIVVRSCLFFAIAALVISLVPVNLVTASNHIDPLLDSGNAVVDRTSVPGETILKYQTTGTSTFAAPYGATNVRVLVVAGGGAGGNNYAGGGGAGEVIHSTSEAVTAGESISVTVGAGGAHCTPETGCTGGSGQDSSFGSTIVAKGGGGGGSGNDNCCNVAPTSGGSGGGGGGYATDTAAQGAAAGAAGTNGTNGVSYRNAGGNGAGVAASQTKAGGGGGGAGAVGAVGTGTGGGKGGDGIQIDITGTNTHYGGGGGAGSNRGDGTGGTGGQGGGGRGGSDTGTTNSTGTGSKGQAGTANTGGGGGGSAQLNIDGLSDTQGGDGGSGIVIIRFTTQFMAISTESLPDGTVGISYSQTLQVAGGTAPYTWSITAGALPTGLSLNTATGVISGDAATEGTSTFTVQVQDSEGEIDTQVLSIKIVIPVVLTTSLPGGGIGVAYSQTLSAGGGTTPYTWSVTTGSLPAGLSLNTSTGAITGTPTTAGTFNFTVQVQDSLGGVDDQALSITINADPVITTASLPDGTLSTAYSQMLAVVAGTEPFTWSLTAGSLPAGLSLNTSTGAITGTPTTAGTSNFTIQVADSHGIVDTQELSITIGDSDGISNHIESAAPNGGDANNDGIADIEQRYVASFINSVTNEYAVLEVDSTCGINPVSITAESDYNIDDSGFNYPAGMMNFTIDCGTLGYIATVTQYYYGVSKEGLVFRKHYPHTNAYFTISGTTIERTTIGGVTAIKATYQVTDGGDLDIDDTVNGVIVDPAGLAEQVVGAPNTGLGGGLYKWLR